MAPPAGEKRAIMSTVHLLEPFLNLIFLLFYSILIDTLTSSILV